MFPLGQDAYDFIEWVAAQPWCDGNVGMIGISYFGSMQVLAAAERPPHLKAIFVSGGHYDFYETTYHGGVMWFMPRAAREGRGGDSGWAFTDRVKSRMLEACSPEELKSSSPSGWTIPTSPPGRTWSTCCTTRSTTRPGSTSCMNDLDGEWYEERNPINLARNIDIPVYLQIDQGRGWTVDGTIELFDVLKGPEKADIGPYPPMQSRPWVEEHDKMFRWYDYWIKGIDNGVMDEPRGERLRRGLARGGHRRAVAAEGRRIPVALPAPAPQAVPRAGADGPRARRAGRLLPGTADGDRPGGDPHLEHRAVRAGHRADRHRRRPPVRRDRPAGHQLHPAALGRRTERQPQLITTGYLKASHRELDERTTEGNPYHPHTRTVPVEPGTIQEYVLRLYPFANTFLPGHRLVAELSNDEPLSDEHNALLPPDAFHLPVGRPVTHKIYRDALHPSRLVLPFTAPTADAE